MIDRIKVILQDNKDIGGYKIVESKTESNELFLIKKNVDMDRAKSVRHFKVTVYRDFEAEGKKYKGSSTVDIHPTMNNNEIKKVIEDAVFAAKFVKNPYYPLAKAAEKYEVMEVGNFSKESLNYWVNEIAKAIYKYDNYEKGSINSCEIFLNKVYTRIVTSEGVDVDSVGYNAMVEFITTWKEEGEEVELYKALEFSDLDAEALAMEAKNMITISRDKAIAKNTPVLEKSAVLLTGDAVQNFFSFYTSKCSAASVYEETSTWKVGEKVQGDDVQGDLITMILDPFMKNSTYSGAFDNDGFSLKPVLILEEGVLKRYIANTRYAHYLGVDPTGSISNIKIMAGSISELKMKEEPYLEVAAFSDFTVDTLTGDFFGEIRLAWYFDGKDTIPVTGGSISGNINDLKDKLYLSKELQKNNNFEGPKVIKLPKVTVAGIEK
jgi:predicted Zn-dependent protease